MKICCVLFFIICNSIVFAQGIFSKKESIVKIDDINILANKVKFQSEINYTLWGKTIKFKQYRIKSYVQRNLSEMKTAINNEEIMLYVSVDTCLNYKDTLIKYIYNYLDKFGKNIYPIASDKNVIIEGSDYILYSQGTKEDEPKYFFTIYKNNKIYRFELTKQGSGFGSIETFIAQKIKLNTFGGIFTFFDSNNKYVSFNSFVNLMNSGFFK